MLTQQMNRLVRLAHNHPHNRVVHRVQYRNRVNVNGRVGQCLTDGGKCAGFVFEKKRELLLNFHDSTSGGWGCACSLAGHSESSTSKVAVVAIVLQMKFVVAFRSEPV